MKFAAELWKVIKVETSSVLHSPHVAKAKVEVRDGLLRFPDGREVKTGIVGRLDRSARML